MNPAPTVTPVEPATAAQNAAALMQHRQTILPRRLAQPGPDESQLDQIFRAAAAAPDHDERLPWRFVLIPASKDTHGHGTHTWAALWKDELAALLKRSE